jgi:Protein of unknown function (DUF3987)
MTGFHEKSTGDYQANLDTFRLLLPVWARKDYIVPEPNVNVPNLGAFFDLANRIIDLLKTCHHTPGLPPHIRQAQVRNLIKRHWPSIPALKGEKWSILQAWDQAVAELAREQEETSEEPAATPAPKPAAPFPTEVFPAPLRKVIEQGAKALPCPPDYIGVDMLAVVAAAMGSTMQVEVKTGWVEPCILYMAVVGDPSSLRSPALSIAVEPVYALQRRYAEKYDADKQQNDKEIKTYERELWKWQKKAAESPLSAGEKPVEPTEPCMAQCWADDATNEALGEVLFQNPHGVILIQDELAGWVRSMNMYRGGKGADRQRWLKRWSAAPDVVNRKNRKQPLLLNRPFVQVVGNINPEVLTDLRDELGRNDGLLPRLLFSYAETIPITWNEHILTLDAREAYAAVVNKIVEARGDTSAPLRTLTFTPGGFEAFRRVIEAMLEQQNHPDTSMAMKGCLGKMKGYAARLAGIMHMARWASGEQCHRDKIDEISVMAAGSLTDYFTAHAEKVYGALELTPADKKVELAMQWIRKHGGKATAREIRMNGVAGVKSATEAKSLLHTLADRGYGTVEDGEKGKITFQVYA